jgi:hypothetical protein
VGGVSSWLLVGVEPGWGEPFGLAVGGQADLPAVLLEVSVVVGAEQAEVVEVGRTAGGPFDDVVDLGVARVLRTAID